MATSAGTARAARTRESARLFYRNALDAEMRKFRQKGVETLGATELELLAMVQYDSPFSGPDITGNERTEFGIEHMFTTSALEERWSSSFAPSQPSPSLQQLQRAIDADLQERQRYHAEVFARRRVDQQLLEERAEREAQERLLNLRIEQEKRARDKAREQELQAPRPDSKRATSAAAAAEAPTAPGYVSQSEALAQSRVASGIAQMEELGFTLSAQDLEEQTRVLAAASRQREEQQTKKALARSLFDAIWQKIVSVASYWDGSQRIDFLRNVEYEPSANRIRFLLEQQPLPTLQALSKFADKPWDVVMKLTLMKYEQEPTTAFIARMALFRELEKGRSADTAWLKRAVDFMNKKDKADSEAYAQKMRETAGRRKSEQGSQAERDAAAAAAEAIRRGKTPEAPLQSAAAAGALETELAKVKKEEAANLAQYLARATDMQTGEYRRQFHAALQHSGGIDEAMRLTAFATVQKPVDEIDARLHQEQAAIRQAGGGPSADPILFGTQDEVLLVQSNLFVNFGMRGIAPVPRQAAEGERQETLLEKHHKIRTQFKPPARAVAGGMEAAVLTSREEMERLADIEIDAETFAQLLPATMSREKYRDILRGVVIAEEQYKGQDSRPDAEVFVGLAAFREFAKKGVEKGILKDLLVKFKPKTGKASKSISTDLHFVPITDEEIDAQSEVEEGKKKIMRSDEEMFESMSKSGLIKSKALDGKTEGKTLAELIMLWANPDEDPDYAASVNAAILSCIWSGLIQNEDTIKVLEEQIDGYKKIMEEASKQMHLLAEARSARPADDPDLEDMFDNERGLRSKVEAFIRDRDKRPLEVPSTSQVLRPAMFETMLFELRDKRPEDIANLSPAAKAHMFVSIAFLAFWIDHYTKLHVLSLLPYLSENMALKAMRLQKEDPTLKEIMTFHALPASFEGIVTKSNVRPTEEEKALEYALVCQQPVDRTGMWRRMDYSDICLLIDLMLRMGSWARMSQVWGTFKEVNSMPEFVGNGDPDRPDNWANAVNTITHCYAIERELRMQCIARTAQYDVGVWARFLLNDTTKMSADARPNTVTDLFWAITRGNTDFGDKSSWRDARHTLRYLRLFGVLDDPGVVEMLETVLAFGDLPHGTRLDSMFATRADRTGKLKPGFETPGVRQLYARVLLIRSLLVESKTSRWPDRAGSSSGYGTKEAGWALAHHYQLHTLIDVHYRLNQLPIDKHSDGNAISRIESVIKHLVAKIAWLSNLLPTHAHVVQLPEVLENLALVAHTCTFDAADSKKEVFEKRPDRITEAGFIGMPEENKKSARKAINRIFKTVNKQKADYPGAALDQPLRLAIALGVLLFPEWLQAPRMQTQTQLDALLQTAKDAKAKGFTGAKRTELSAAAKNAAKLKATDPAADAKASKELNDFTTKLTAMIAKMEKTAGSVGVFAELEQSHHSGMLQADPAKPEKNGMFHFVGYGEKALTFNPSARSKINESMGYGAVEKIEEKVDYKNEERLPVAFLHWLPAFHAFAKQVPKGPKPAPEEQQRLIMKTEAISRLECLIDDMTDAKTLEAMPSDEARLPWKFLRALVYIRCNMDGSRARSPFVIYRDAAEHVVVKPTEVRQEDLDFANGAVARKAAQSVQRVKDQDAHPAVEATNRASARYICGLVPPFVGMRARLDNG